MNPFLNNIKQSVSKYFKKEKFEILLTNNEWIFKKYKDENVEFNNTKLLFNSDKTLITSNEQEVIEAKWKYLNDHNELFINFDDFKLLLKPIYISEALILFETHKKGDFFIFFNPNIIKSDYDIFHEENNSKNLYHFENGLIIHLKNNLKIVITQTLDKNVKIEELKNKFCIILDRNNDIITNYSNLLVSQSGKTTFEIVNDLIVDVFKNKVIFIQNNEFQIVGLDENYSKNDLINKVILNDGFKIKSSKITDNKTCYFIENSIITHIEETSEIRLKKIGTITLTTVYHYYTKNIHANCVENKLNGKYKDADTGNTYIFKDNVLVKEKDESVNIYIIITIIILVVLLYLVFINET